jgi:hypothetical protein
MKETHRREAVLLIVCVILMFTLLYLVMLNSWGIHLWDKSIDYSKFGNWSDAVTGLATTGAIIVALATLLWQRRSQQIAEAAKEIEAETAVFQWITSKEVRDESDQLVGRLWDARVQNSTVAPVYHWKLSFESDHNHLCSQLKRPLLPGENVFNLYFLDNVEPSKAPEPVLIFQGRSGRFWTRSANGILQLASHDDLRCKDTVDVSFPLL